MKKFLVILMVVAMSSFLFVGCLPGVTPVEPVEPVEPVVPVVKTDTPYITDIGGIDLYGTDTQYTKSATVTAVGVAGAVIKVYINGVQSGVGTTANVGTVTVDVSMMKLTEGVKKLYITATAPGLAESDKSTEYTFTVDLTAPKIASAVADSSANSITVTFNEAVNMATTSTTTASSALTETNWIVNGVELSEDDGFEKLTTKIVRITPVADIGTGGDVFSVSCKLIADTLTNAMGVGTLSTYVGVIVE